MRTAPSQSPPSQHHFSHPPSRRAFTLIEILIAVLILALGILGLGAVFPAVIRQQRVGVEATSGALAANCAKTLLTTLDYEQVLAPVLPPARADLRDFWRNWRDSNNGTYGLRRVAFENGEWFVPQVDIPGNPSGTVMGLDGDPRFSFRLPISERLYPYGSSNVVPPQFVWDIAIHRLSDGIADSYAGVPPPGSSISALDPLQVAIFVRKIDARIRPATGQSIFQSFTAAGAARRYPVGGNNATGLPSFDGTGGYARLFTAPATFIYNPPAARDRDRLYFAVTPEKWAVIRQSGQRLIDNLGNAYTVTGDGEDSTYGKYVRIDPPVPAGIPQSAAGSGPGQGIIRQVVVAPNVPAAVLLFKVVDP